jgi:methylated-DNA-[protein]-cysteine S-methyltransferase
MSWNYLQMTTPLGTLRIAMHRPHPGTLPVERRGLAGAWFVDDQKYVPPLTSDWHESPDDAFLFTAQQDIHAWFAGDNEHFATALMPSGTPFQERVWEGLLGIEFGKTESYAALTHRLGMSATSVRAVAGAVGRNPISVLIPCHRVVGSDGSLTGYAGGLPRKQYLLTHEQSRRQASMPFTLSG